MKYCSSDWCLEYNFRHYQEYTKIEYFIATFTWYEISLLKLKIRHHLARVVFHGPYWSRQGTISSDQLSASAVLYFLLFLNYWRGNPICTLLAIARNFFSLRMLRVVFSLASSSGYIPVCIMLHLCRVYTACRLVYTSLLYTCIFGIKVSMLYTYISFALIT